MIEAGRLVPLRPIAAHSGGSPFLARKEFGWCFRQLSGPIGRGVWVMSW